MRRFVGVRKWTKVASFVVVAAVIAVSCGSDKKSTSTGVPTGTAGQGTTTPGGTGATPSGNARELVIDRDMDLTTLDLSLTYCDTCQIFNTAVYETLITVDPADPNKLLPRLATSWEANADNTVFTFKLDPAAKFDDGSAVEAKDVKFSWERLENMKGSASYLMAGLKSIDDSRRGHRRRHVRGAQLGVPADRRCQLPRHHEQRCRHGARCDVGGRRSHDRQGRRLVPLPLGGQRAVHSSSRTPKATSWCWPATTTTGERRSRCSHGSPSLRSRTRRRSCSSCSRATPTSPCRSRSTRSPSCKATPTSPQSSSTRTTSCTSPSARERRAARSCKTSTFARPSKKPSTTTARFRRWLPARARSRRRRSPTGSPVAPICQLPEYNLDDAKKLLSDAGFADGFDLDATYPDANVYGVDFNLMMQKIQQDLAKVKINLKLTPIQFPDWVTRIGDNGIPVTAVYFAPDHTDTSQYIQYFGLIPDSFWAASAGGGSVGKPMDNPKESDLLAQALASSGDAKAKAYTDAGQQMIDDQIIIPIVNTQLVLASRSDITGMHYSACCNLDLSLLGLAG